MLFFFSHDNCDSQSHSRKEGYDIPQTHSMKFQKGFRSMTSGEIAWNKAILGRCLATKLMARSLRYNILFSQRIMHNHTSL